jgi:hypothetical protein
MNQLATAGLALSILVSMAPSLAEPVGNVPENATVVDPAAADTPAPESVWSLGIALIGAGVILRPKAA